MNNEMTLDKAVKLSDEELDGVVGGRRGIIDPQFIIDPTHIIDPNYIVDPVHIIDPIYKPRRGQ
ncbi:MAG: hypothetical protein CL388_04395 [Acidiferrobacteraceae bacterium]|nr:hypothetical protein [Acidiferrobacteraceae bacterium]MDP6672952.1 hypothetical protein [Arenicellales bacterium]